MKKFTIKLACAALAAVSAFSLCACNNGGDQQKETTAPTAAETTAEPTTAPKAFVKETDLKKLHPVNAQGDRFAGTWQITDGTGSQLESFYYEFNGSGTAYMMVGTMGFCGTYGIKAENGQDLFITQLMFGLNGKYTYEFSKDRNTVVLTNIEDKTTSTIEKTDSYSPVPDAPENPEIDEAILGAWADERGNYLYFGKDGVMYDMQGGVTFYFYTYSAANGKISQTYSMVEDVEETSTYKLEGETLTYNNIEYKPVSADELI